jgi:hypothetical protein
MAERHGVVPLVYEKAKSVADGHFPRIYRQQLAARYKEIVVHGLRLTAELTRLVSLFRDIGIEILPYKGPLLALRLYGSVGLRQFSDLDFLVRIEQVPLVFSALQQCGFAQVSPQPSVQLSDYQRFNIEYMFCRDGGRVVVEPHWAVVPPTLAIDLDMNRMWLRSESCEMYGVRVRTLCPEDLLMILCVHAFKHRFSKLKWIVDIARLLERFPLLDWVRVRGEAQVVGAERIILFGITLANELLAAPVPAELRPTSTEYKSIRPLLNDVYRDLFGPVHVDDPFELSRFYFSARERWRERMKYVARTAFTPRSKHLAIVSLPSEFRWVHYFLKPLHDYGALPCWRVLKRIGVRRASGGTG